VFCEVRGLREKEIGMSIEKNKRAADALAKDQIKKTEIR